MILHLAAECCDLELEDAPPPAEPTGTSGSSRRDYFLGEPGYRPTSRHQVRALQAGAEIANCILSASGGASGIHAHSALVRDDECVVCVGPFLCALRLPGLEPAWSVQADEATCFGVYYSPELHRYVVHGELSITGVSELGELLWSAYGKDIFTGEFALCEEHARAVDFNGEVYHVDLAIGRSCIVSD